MLNILLVIILIIIIFIIFLLCIGVKIAFTYDKKDSEFKGCLKILILKKIPVITHEFPEKKDERDDDEEDDGKRDFKKTFDLAKPCFEYFKEFIKSAASSTHITKLENEFTIGFDSFYDTGKNIGYIWAFLSLINTLHKNAKLSAKPSFNGSVFDCHGTNEIDINIIKIIPSLIKLISKKEVRKLIKGVRNG